MADIEAYNAARKMFNEVRGADAALLSLLEEYNSHYLLHNTVADAISKTSGNHQDALIANLAEHEGLITEIEERYKTLTDTYRDASDVLNGLEDPGDKQVLYMYYCQGLSEREIPKHLFYGKRTWNYSSEYVAEKKAKALVNAGYVMRDLGLVLKYS